MSREITNEQLKPLGVYRNCVSEYNDRWYEDYVTSAYFNLARDKGDNLLPHCIVLGLLGGSTKEHFTIVERAGWCLEVVIFHTDNDMAQWILAYGPSKVSSFNYVNPK